MRFLLILACAGVALHSAELPAVHNVYLLPMTHGLDQYLADRLTNEHIFQVVTDPKLADAIFTDRIGTAFEDKLAEILPPPGPAKASKETSGQASSLVSEPANKLSDPLTSSTFGRAKGMVFLVNPKSKQVVWSAYQPPKDTSAGQMERAASHIVTRLKRDLKTPEAK